MNESIEQNKEAVAVDLPRLVSHFFKRATNRPLSDKIDDLIKKKGMSWLNPQFIAKKLEVSESDVFNDLERRLEAREVEKASVFECPSGAIIPDDPIPDGDELPRDYFDYMSGGTYDLSKMPIIKVYAFLD